MSDFDFWDDEDPSSHEPQGEWVTQDGEVWMFSEMSTSHLFYSVRMIYNHTAPPAYQIPGCRRYEMDWPADIRRKAISDLMAELSTREDIKPWMIEQIRQMRDCIRKLRIPELA